MRSMKLFSSSSYSHRLQKKPPRLYLLQKERMPTLKEVGALVGFMAASFACGFIGSFATRSNIHTWYQTLKKPSFNPPNWIFGPVWTTLYGCMSVAAWLIWRRYGGLPPDADAKVVEAARELVKRPLIAWGIQLALNFMWTPLFFGYHQIGAALFEMILMLGAICWTTKEFWPIDRRASFLMFPYIAWVSFATVLTFSIWILNSSEGAPSKQR
jgi:benzodiazapine receptor